MHRTDWQEVLASGTANNPRLAVARAGAGVVHYFWRVKLDVQRPLIYAALSAFCSLFVAGTPSTGKSSPLLCQYVLTVLVTLGDFGNRFALVLELDVRRD